MKQLTVFLVDNYLLTRISNKRQLENDCAFKVLGDFKNAKECFSALELCCPDVILIDTELSDINGIEVCKLIKEKYPKIKVIINTSDEDDEKVLASLSSGASAYIIKGKDDIGNAIKIVASGSFLIDFELAKSAFAKIPPPKSKKPEDVCDFDAIKQNLTQRELEVLRLIIDGKTNSQIAKEIFVSTNTAKAHVGNILEKFGVKDRVQAAVMAVRANLF